MNCEPRNLLILNPSPILGDSSSSPYSGIFFPQACAHMRVSKSMPQLLRSAFSREPPLHPTTPWLPNWGSMQPSEASRIVSFPANSCPLITLPVRHRASCAAAVLPLSPHPFWHRNPSVGLPIWQSARQRLCCLKTREREREPRKGPRDIPWIRKSRITPSPNDLEPKTNPVTALNEHYKAPSQTLKPQLLPKTNLHKSNHLTNNSTK